MLDYFVPPSRFQKLTLITAIVTYALVVLGGVVRVTGSGLGCPDWPLCYGQPLPSEQTEAIIEMAHRYVAALVTLLVIAVGVTAWRSYRQNKWIFRAAMVGLGVIFFQIILGAITVLLKNHPLTVVAHFGAALTMLACATIVATAARLPSDVRSSGATPLRKWALLSAVFVLGLLFFGALVTGTRLGVGLPDRLAVVPRRVDSQFDRAQHLHQLVPSFLRIDYGRRLGLHHAGRVAQQRSTARRVDRGSLDVELLRHSGGDWRCGGAVADSSGVARLASGDGGGDVDSLDCVGGVGSAIRANADGGFTPTRSGRLQPIGWQCACRE